MLLKTEANRNQWSFAKAVVVKAHDLGFGNFFEGSYRYLHVLIIAQVSEYWNDQT